MKKITTQKLALRHQFKSENTNKLITNPYKYFGSISTNNLIINLVKQGTCIAISPFIALSSAIGSFAVKHPSIAVVTALACYVSTTSALPTPPKIRSSVSPFPNQASTSDRSIDTSDITKESIEINANSCPEGTIQGGTFITDLGDEVPICIGINTPESAPPLTAPLQLAEIAKSSAFPEVVYVRVDKSMCTGTVIDEDAVLTAAHCVKNITSSTLEKVEIFSGLNYRADIEITTPHTAKDIRYFSKYINSDDYTHDVAIIRTQETFPVNSIKRLPTDEECKKVKSVLDLKPSSEDFRATGWGYTKRGRTKELRTVKLSAKKSTQGIESFDKNESTGKLNAGICLGDSGGHYITKHQKQAEYRLV